MGELTIHTLDWVPEGPRGFVRDLRVRWALEEAGLPYQVAGTPFADRKPDHFAHQPFGQVPWLTDGDVSIFESGAILVYLGERNEALMPVDPRGRAEVQEWVFAALNSVEMAVLPWAFGKFSGDDGASALAQWIDGFVKLRLGHMETVLSKREWLTGGFSVADILMADVLRLADRFDALKDYPACRAYLTRATARPAFQKAHADQLAYYAEADKVRAKADA